MVRSGGAAASSSPLAGAPAPRGRAGRAGGPGALPARPARHRRGGQGSLGRDDGRLALYRPDRLALLLPPADAPAGPMAEAWLPEVLRDQLARRGASFYRDLLGEALAGRRPPGGRPPTQRELLDALWELVWAGEVTNDTFAPLRALRWKRSSRDPVRPRPARPGRA